MTDWDNLKKSLSVDEQITSSPWGDNKSTGVLSNQMAMGSINPATAANNTSTASASAAALDNEVASIISGLSGTANSNFFTNGKSNSVFAGSNVSYNFQNGLKESAIASDAGSDILNPTAASSSTFGINKDALSAISAPVNPLGSGNGAGGSQSLRLSSNLFASASVAGAGVYGGVPSFGNNSKFGTGHFLEKFASVTEKTREMELNFGKFSIGSNNQKATELIGSRRSSVLNTESANNASPNAFGDAALATGKRSARPSFSEKLETYMNSPNNGRHLSFSSEINHSEHSSVVLDPSTDHPTAAKHNIWNPATASVFTPLDKLNDSSSYFNNNTNITNNNNNNNPNFNFLKNQQQQQQQQAMFMSQMMPYGNMGSPLFQFPQMGFPFMPPMNVQPNFQFNLQQQQHQLQQHQQQQQQMQQQMQTESQTSPPNPDSDKQDQKDDEGLKSSSTAPNTANTSTAATSTNSTEAIGSSEKDKSETEDSAAIKLEDSTDVSNNPGAPDANGNLQFSPQAAAAAAAAAASMQGGVGVDANGRPMSPFVVAPFGTYGMFPTPMGFDGSSPQMTMPVNNGLNSPSPYSNGPLDIRNMQNPGLRGSTPPRDFGKNNGKRSPKNGNTPTSNSKSNKRAPHIYRSPLLEEFRNNKSNKKYTLKDIYSHGIEFSKDQHGSRFIQQQLHDASEQDKEVIFNEIREVAVELMTDVFGNYVIQKYFEHGSKVQRDILLESMTGKIHTLSLQMYGCRVVQRALEAVTLDQKLSVLDELKSSVLPLVKDQNGNHVIQKSIECIPIERIGFILDSLKLQIYHLSTHPYGCRVIQRLLEYANEDDQRFILNELKGYIYYLIQDQYGNYVIQHIIEHGEPQDRNAVTDIVLNNLVELSKHKFASNAVEKCIIHGDSEYRELLYKKILKDNLDPKEPVDDESYLALMMKDPFANYVVQKMVELSQGENKKLLIIKIKQYLDIISRANYGKHLASIEKLLSLSESV
ncbi:hypothetical protein B5S33_g3997 [[Candida] boidinii]|nr:hypothetical protein B5S33_g3997 [[Candida] boidinii]